MAVNRTEGWWRRPWGGSWFAPADPEGDRPAAGGRLSRPHRSAPGL